MDQQRNFNESVYQRKTHLLMLFTGRNFDSGQVCHSIMNSITIAIGRYPQLPGVFCHSSVSCQSSTLLFIERIKVCSITRSDHKPTQYRIDLITAWFLDEIALKRYGYLEDKSNICWDSGVMDTAKRLSISDVVFTSDSSQMFFLLWCTFSRCRRILCTESIAL